MLCLWFPQDKTVFLKRYKEKQVLLCNSPLTFSSLGACWYQCQWFATQKNPSSHWVPANANEQTQNALSVFLHVSETTFSMLIANASYLPKQKPHRKSNQQLHNWQRHVLPSFFQHPKQSVSQTWDVRIHRSSLSIFILPSAFCFCLHLRMS